MFMQDVMDGWSDEWTNGSRPEVDRVLSQAIYIYMK